MNAELKDQIRLAASAIEEMKVSHVLCTKTNTRTLTHTHRHTHTHTHTHTRTRTRTHAKKSKASRCLLQVTRSWTSQGTCALSRYDVPVL